MRLTGKMVKGRRVYDDPVSFAIANREVGEGERFEEEFDRLRERRSTRANRRYWGVLVPLARHALNLKRPGLLPLNKTQTHALLVTAFLGSEETPLGPVPVATRESDTKTFHRLTSQTELWLGEQGFVIPEEHEAERAIEQQEGAA